MIPASGRLPRALATALGIGTGLALPAALVPATRPTAVVVISVLATVAPAVGALRHRAVGLLPWVVVTGMLVGWTLSITFGTRWPGFGERAQDAGTVFGLGLALYLFTRHVRSLPTDRRTRERAVWGRRADLAVLVVLFGLAAAQVVTTAHAPDAPPSAFWAPIDVMLVALVLRLLFSRAGLTTSLRLFIAACVAAAVYDAVASSSGLRLQPLHAPVSMVWALAMALVVLAALHPSMTTAFSSATLRRLRPESGRVLGLVALAPVPLALALLPAPGRLPLIVHVAAGTAVSALAIVRGAQALLSSEGHAARDPLTGLANRRGLQIAFDQLLVDARPGDAEVGRVALLDLDDFKAVNDTHGHETGDLLLCAVGERLSAAVGGDGTVARSGGDEFVLVLRPGAPSVQQLLSTAFGSPVQLAGLARRSVPVRCSAGWVPLSPASELPLALADADIALYASKGAHRGAATEFAPQQREAVLGQLGLGEDLRRLVAGDPAVGSLFLLFQPLVDMRTRAVLGCEALVRWQHPTRGLLGPDTFLPVAELQGQGAAVDTWVLDRACAVAATWAEQGLERTVSVNLGRSSMIDPGLSVRVRRALRSTGLPPGRLHLEITEHDQLPAEAGVAQLHELAELGVRVSLDDFGTGYTSLAYLHRYPVSMLKLDRSVTGHDTSAELISGITSLAGALGIEVLAEGVECEAQHARLVSFGIDAGQGWLYGQPVPADQLPAASSPRR
ncbi:putative bifunctional diguanylate cyclase/phosphodiesterase [Klenkia marina]|uniref:putative bifunctional diguanylate cyclase/phosphodiesterase n=1 Tax=Klenkia marina TaxID=1960309 RepID=UPI00105A9103|nr:bifunctional diguanylate cyclase/phosphodiesterase [Klenkia marina]